MTQQEMKDALHHGGFAFSSDDKGWVGHGVVLRVEHIQGLELWELDQVITGAQRGADLVELGDKVFEFGD